MKIHLLSDLHLEFHGFNYTKPEGADILVLAGDIGVEQFAKGEYVPMGIDFASKLPIDSLYIAGNHEFYTGYKKRTMQVMRENLQEHASRYNNVFYAENSIHAIQDVMFVCATLWTDFADGDVFVMNECKTGMNDYNYIYKEEDKGYGTETITPSYIYTLHKQSLEFIKEMGDLPFEGKKVLITHHAPSYRSLTERFVKNRYNGAYYSDLDAVLQDYDFAFHGHSHQSVDYQIGNCRVVANPRGYTKKGGIISEENKKFDPLLLIDTHERR